MSTKLIWMRRQRVLRRFLRRYRESKKIDSKLYHEFYLLAKGNQFKNKRVLMSGIHKAKNEAIRLKNLEEQQEARRQRSKNIRAKRNARNQI